MENKDEFYNYSPDINYEPKRETSFLVTFSEPFELIPCYVVNKCSRPMFFVETNRWGSMFIELHDPVEPSTTMCVYNGLLDTKFQQNRKTKLKIELLDPAGVSVEQWIIDAELTDVYFGELSYGSDATAKVTLYFDVKDVKFSNEKEQKIVIDRRKA